MFTEKERLILKALLEEELQTILKHVSSRDALINRYIFSLARILSKIDVDEAEDSGMERFYTLSQEFAASQAA